MKGGERMKKIVILVIGIIFLGSLGVLFAQQCCEKKVSEKEKKCDYAILGNKVICPVTGEKFTITKDSECAEYKGKIYFFCCPGCKPKFETNPEKYIEKIPTQHKH